ncbi:MAG: Gfo/Idh/MocA family oxidoreductase, partial [Armatimonadota bacterium]|nr:Gfo/Idh/MocA family oxidoreductase [Armatimonadota bacterium]
MTDSAVRIGLVGYGVIGKFHLDLWAKTEGVKVVAVCDVIPERAREAAELAGAKAYIDYTEMLNHDGLDAVDICTPSGLHAQQGIQAAELKLHV